MSHPRWTRCTVALVGVLLVPALTASPAAATALGEKLSAKDEAQVKAVVTRLNDPDTKPKEWCRLLTSQSRAKLVTAVAKLLDLPDGKLPACPEARIVMRNMLGGLGAPTDGTVTMKAKATATNEAVVISQIKGSNGDTARDVVTLVKQGGKWRVDHQSTHTKSAPTPG